MTLKVQRVDRPRQDLLALSLYGARRRLVLLVHIGAGGVEVGVVNERPRGDPADSRVRQLRKRLVGARLRSLDRFGHDLSLHFVRAEESCFLWARPSRSGAPELRLLHSEDEGHREQLMAPDALLDPGMLEQGEALLGELGGRAFEERRRVVERTLARRLKKLLRRERAIAGDLRRIDGAPTLRADGQLVLANLHQLGRGDSALTAMDWTLDPPCERTIQLDPSREPKLQAERFFHRARRLERGRAIAQERLVEAGEERQRLEACLHEVRAEVDEARLLELESSLGRRLERAAKGKGKREVRLPFRRYIGSGERPVLVGRGAGDNDALTLHHARPWDLWLHARGVEGAHVIVPSQRGEACPSELLVDAASLAAHHSRARGQALVDVQYVARRHVRKPRGFAPGAVRVEREKVLRLRVDPERVRRLLKTRQE